MDWEPWIESGAVRVVEFGGRQLALTKVKKGWDCVIEARGAYLQGNWNETDERLRGAFTVGITALLLREKLEMVYDLDLEVIQRISRELLETRLVDSVCERARILRNIMPLDPIVEEPQLRLIRRSIAASSEYVAMAEAFCFLQESPV